MKNKAKILNIQPKNSKKHELISKFLNRFLREEWKFYSIENGTQDATSIFFNEKLITLDETRKKHTLFRAIISDPRSISRSKYDTRLSLTAYISGVIPVICNNKT